MIASSLWSELANMIFVGFVEVGLDKLGIAYGTGSPVSLGLVTPLFYIRVFSTQVTTAFAS